MILETWVEYFLASERSLLPRNHEPLNLFWILRRRQAADQYLELLVDALLNQPKGGLLAAKQR